MRSGSGVFELWFASVGDLEVLTIGRPQIRSLHDPRILSMVTLLSDESLGFWLIRLRRDSAIFLICQLAINSAYLIIGSFRDFDIIGSL